MEAAEAPPPDPAHFTPPPAPPRPIAFEYTGATGLSLRGPITGRGYRFNGPGARVDVDARDAAWIGGVPNLRRVAAR
jgi:hypothetical protein